mgnify:CR=1 FL=1
MAIAKAFLVEAGMVVVAELLRVIVPGLMVRVSDWESPMVVLPVSEKSPEERVRLPDCMVSPPEERVKFPLERTRSPDDRVAPLVMLILFRLSILLVRAMVLSCTITLVSVFWAMVDRSEMEEEREEYFCLRSWRD